MSIKYDLSFDAVKERIIQRIKEKYPNKVNDFTESNIGTVFIEAVAFAIDMLGFYVNQLENELFFDKARQRRSVVSLARLIGYSPKRKKPAGGTVTFFLDSPWDKDIIIPKGTRLEVNGIYYETEDTVTLKAGKKEVSVRAIQREVQTLIFTARGEFYESFEIKDKRLYDVKVYVDGKQYFETDNLVLNETNAFKIEETPESYVITIVNPPKNSRVLMEVLLTEGSKGNILSGRLTNIVDTITDISGNVVPVMVRNDTPFTGGTDEESIEEIKRNAIVRLKTNERAVTGWDYENLAKTLVEGVKYAVAFSPEPGVVDLYIATEDINGNPVVADDALKRKVDEVLAVRRALTDKVNIKDVQFVPIDIKLSIKGIVGYNLESIRQKAINLLRNYFKSLSPGQAFRISDIYRLIDEIDGVDYCHIIAPSSDVIPETTYKLLTLGEVTIEVS
ncbi:Baseplate J-like protein [Balnearium lithotrophicum]|uniref:Baseplate J-like protein n=1 Tax=Balnearium lithotrophicum TaxID=223788 RepID=A0A521CK67_9BACT|nr:baseplate J/gp47 family protein [Balnearium lithotrophicum]SMO59070.1 Baseplate J-like protein [Balnearium lithotrophicum]